MPAIGLSFICLAVAVTAAPPARSGSITWLRSGRTLAVANPDADSVTLVGTEPLEKPVEIPVGGQPRAVAAGSDGKTLCVTLPETDRLVWVDLDQRQKSNQLQTPGGPFAVVAHPTAARVYVAATYAHLICEVDLRGVKLERQLPVEPFPRGLAISPDGRQLYVVHFFTGDLSIVDTVEWKLLAHISNGADANLARSVALTPDNRTAFIPHLLSNTSNPRLLFDNSVLPVVTRLDLIARSVTPRDRIALDAIGRPTNNPWDAVVSGDGERLYVVNAGSDDVQVIDIQSGRSLAQIDVGNNPRGIVLSADGHRLYVHNTLSHDLSLIDTNSLRELRRVALTRSRLGVDIQRGEILFNSAQSRAMTLDCWISCASCHPDGESDGRTWLFPAGKRRTPSLRGAALTMPHNRWPDRDEVQDTEAFIRHVMAGRGLIPGGEPPAKLGTPSAGRSHDADALAAYVLSLRPRRSPLAEGDAKRLAAIERGRDIFFSPNTLCSHCHPPPYYTDSQLSNRPWQVHDVGTGDPSTEQLPRDTSLGFPLPPTVARVVGQEPSSTRDSVCMGTGFDTPSLFGLYTSPTFLHDGRATHLSDVFTIHNPDDRHGVTSQLNEEELDCLVAFLLSLPATEVSIPE